MTTLSSESHAERIDRVRQMVDDVDGQTWDLSLNDVAALETVLADRDALLAALKGYRMVLAPWIQRPPKVLFAEWEAAVDRIDGAIAQAQGQSA